MFSSNVQSIHKDNNNFEEIFQEIFFLYKFGLFVCLFVCLLVCLYPINVKTAEPIWPKFFEGSRVTPGKVYGWSNFQKFASIKIRFLKILKIHKVFFENPRNFLFLLCVNKENPSVFFFRIKFFTNEIKNGREKPSKPKKRHPT